MMAAPGLDDEQQKLIAEKRAEYEEGQKQQDAFSEQRLPGRRATLQRSAAPPP